MNYPVSIITPMYNSQRFIASAIRSVQGQTYQNWEMIIIDDNSNDNSVDIVKDIAGNDRRIKFISLEIFT